MRMVSFVLALVVLSSSDCGKSPAGPPPEPRVGYYAAPTGSSSGTGTFDQPWDLATALAGGNGAIQQGDTVWLRGGTYRGAFTSVLTGTPAAPVIVRGFPGERATVDGYLRIEGQDVTFWGFEVMQSDPATNSYQAAIEPFASGLRLVNLVIHDASAQGINFRTDHGYSEVYGCIIYNNGTAEDLDHGIYAPNDAGEKRITDNIVFNNLAFGIHVYGTSNHPVLTNVTVEGNVAFNTGAISTQGPRWANVLLGADPTTQQVRAIDNMLYFSGASGVQLRFGVNGPDVDVTGRGNYAVGGGIGLEIQEWQTAIIQNNTFVGPARTLWMSDPTLSGYTWQNNVYYRDPAATAWRWNSDYTFTAWKSATGLGASDQAIAGSPPTNKVFVRPNAYEAGRGHIVVYNFEGLSGVAVNVSGILQSGDQYEVRNAQAIFGGPVVSGTYSGGTISVPMSGVNPPAPIGRSTPAPPKTGPAFDVFVLTRIP